MEPAKHIALESAFDQPSFQAVAEEHRLWLESEGREGRRANLKDADLRYVDLQGVRLSQANLRGADLRGCDLRGADLAEADFTEARLSSTNLSAVNLVRANFSGADLERSLLDGARLSEANLTNANLADASLKGADLHGAIMRQTVANRGHFENADMSLVSGRGCQMAGAQFHQTRMNQSDFREAALAHAVFIDVLFEQTQFKSADFEGVSFSESDFSEALEIGQGFQATAFAQEKRRMQEERQKFEAIAADLQRRENDLSMKRAETMDQDQHERTASGKLGGLSTRMKAMTVLWMVLFLCLLGGVLLAVSSLPLAQLNMMELAIVLGSGGLLVLLSLGTWLSTLQAMRQLKEVLTLRERKLFASYNESNESHSPNQPGNSADSSFLTPLPSLSLPLEIDPSEGHSGLSS